MKNKTKLLFHVTALAAALGLGALQMSAQEGTFKLPVAAHWGGAVLQPGEHTVRVPVTGSGQRLVYLITDKNTQMTVPITSQPLTGASRSYLHLVKINGTYYVDAYQSEVNGAKFFFPKPKPNRTAGPIAEEESTIISVASN